MKPGIILFTVLCIPFLAFSATIYVPDHYPTIQQAIDAAVNGDTIIVRPGTYVENIDYNGKIISLKSELGPEKTIIDGNQAGNVVMIGFDLGPETILEGFTITNSGASGSGIACRSPAVIRNNIITGNTALSGGGIACWEAATITKNKIVGNTSHYGGGIHCKSEPTIIDNIISDNTGSSIGGGMYCLDASPVIAGNIISNNSTGWGGGINCNNSFPTFTNNIISGNTGSDWGGGISSFNSSILIDNNTIAGNKVINFSGGGIYSKTSSIVVVNTIFWNNEAPTGPEISIKSTSTLAIDYSNVKGGQPFVYVDPGCTLNWGAGMIDADPLFVDPANNDFHLTYNSPCRNTGDNTAVTEPFDFEGDPRPAWSGTVDMGADEFYTHLYCMGDFFPNGSIEGKLVGTPGTSPVGLFMGSGVLDPPVPTIWGNFHLQSPWLLIPLVPVPGDGVLVLPATIPATPAAPYDLPVQALIGLAPDSLTNLFVMEIR
ncbi:MAG: right-handed parallel beta-helix repeat-containing protein [Planctomycetota bacterium]